MSRLAEIASLQLAARLSELRRERAWTQESAARRAGLSQAEWSKLERGTGHDPRLSSLLGMQAAFGLGSLEQLFGLSPSDQLVQASKPDPR